ncbi:hypothetical protein ACJX0J_037549, partial [Zea mays]
IILGFPFFLIDNNSTNGIFDELIISMLYVVEDDREHPINTGSSNKLILKGSLPHVESNEPIQENLRLHTNRKSLIAKGFTHREGSPILIKEYVRTILCKNAIFIFILWYNLLLENDKEIIWD